MKKILIVIGLIWCGVGVFAQADTIQNGTTYWTKGGFFNVNFNQVQLSNWAAGGQNSVALSGLFNAFKNYKKDKTTWDNSLDMGYGIVRTGKDTRKNDDRIEFNSKYGHQAFKKNAKWYYSGLLNFKTQFDEGFDFSADNPILISDKFAPAFLTLALGLDYKPSDALSVFISPATGKSTMVFGDRIDETTYGLDTGATTRNEFGAYLTAKYQNDVIKNVNVKSVLELFNNYTDVDVDNRKNIDVNWETMIAMKVNKYITTSIGVHLRYDHNIDIPVDRDGDGEPDGTGKRTQFKQVLAVGFSYKFNSVSKKLKKK